MDHLITQITVYANEFLKHKLYGGYLNEHDCKTLISDIIKLIPNEPATATEDI